MNVKILIGQYSKHVNHSLYACAMARTIAVLSSWPLTLDPPHRSKILDLNTCLTLPPQIQLSGCFELKLHHCIPLSFLPSTHCFRNNLTSWEILFWFHKCPQKFTSPLWNVKHFIGQYTVYDSWRQHLMLVGTIRRDRPSGHFSKFWVLSASISFLSSPPPTLLLLSPFCAVFSSRSLFFAPKLRGNTCYAGYSNAG